MENNLDLPSGIIDGALGGNATYGSLTYQTVAARETDELHINWNLVAGSMPYEEAKAFVIICKEKSDRPNECAYDAGGNLIGSVEVLTFNHYGFDREASSTMANSSVTGASYMRQTGWKESVYPIPSTGNYIIGIGIMDVNSNYGAHMLLVDDVVLQSTLSSN